MLAILLYTRRDGQQFDRRDDTDEDEDGSYDVFRKGVHEASANVAADDCPGDDADCDSE